MFQRSGGRNSLVRMLLASLVSVVLTLLGCSSKPTADKSWEDVSTPTASAAMPSSVTKSESNNPHLSPNSTETRAGLELVSQAVSAITSDKKPAEQMVSIRCVLDQATDSNIQVPCPRLEFLVEDMQRHESRSILTANGAIRFSTDLGHSYRLHLDSKEYEWKMRGPASFKGGDKAQVRIQRRTDLNSAR